MAETRSHMLPILSLDDVVVLPHMTVTLAIEEEAQRGALAAARQGASLLLLVPRHEGRLSAIGTIARVLEVGELPNGVEVAVLAGEQRARLGAEQAAVAGTLWVQEEPIEEPEPPTERAARLGREYRALVENLFDVRGVAGASEFLRETRSPAHLADMAGYSRDLTYEQKLELLETGDLERRLELLIEWTKEVLAQASLKEQIRSEVAEGMAKSQRDFLLRQQLEAIRRQLGESDNDVAEAYRRRLETSRMPEAIRAEVEREIARLDRTGEQNPEYGWIRTYLDWMFDVPWGVRSDDRYDLVEARRVLDEDHNGLEDVKDRIIEFLAVRKLRHERGLGVGGRGAGAIITLIGPPGTGKTSLGESVARALRRKFARFSLGGIRDEAEIRGFRRTYVGAMPGRIVRALKEAGTINPVIMLDEIDKVGADWRGDPSAALLEVLDPAQNNTFRDHYLEVDLDLSEVLFIPTGNVADTILPALRDRMEIITLDGYTESEKVAIARDHLLPRQVSQAGLTAAELAVADSAVMRVIVDYTREAGVRNLERELGRITRKVATGIASGELTPPVTVEAEGVRRYLDRPLFHNEDVERTAAPGVAAGLAVTGAGGDVIFVEATTTGSEGTLTLTGQLGDVMKESAQIALSYVRSHTEALGIPQSRAARSFHLHVPAGAVPKDGPSAGITMATAIVSLLTGRQVRAGVGMTGEVTLQGLVLPVGGIKQKALAAHRMGLTDVILPAQNREELDSLPANVRNGLRFHPLSTMDDVLAVALEPRRRATRVAAQHGNGRARHRVA